ncbi:reverse transcriptase domain-containing protein [Tanacetum coccineum]
MQAWDKFLEIKHAQSEEVQELLNKLLEDVQNISEELAEFINSPSWSHPTFYLDDDEEYTIAITPGLSTEEPEYSLSMGDEHLDTIPATESDKVIKSSVENLVPIPRGVARLASDTKSIPYDTFDGKFYSNPLFDEEIISDKIDASIISSPKIDSLLEQFSVERLLYDNSSPLPLEEVNSTEYFPPSHIPVEGSDSLMEDIDLFLASNESIPPDVSVESVGSSFPRVILIGSISVEVSVALEVGAAAVASPAWVLELDTHSLSKSDTEIPERHVSAIPHDDMLTRWRSRVASRSSSPTTSTLEIPTAPILPAPSAIVTPSSEALTARKSVRPLPSHRLALRYTSHHLDHFTSGSSSSHSSSDHLSSGHSISGHSLPGHTPPDTTNVDSSTPPRFVHPSLVRTPRCSEAYLRWRSASLSTMYPPMTSDSSAGDSSFKSSAGPSRKRCRSLAAIVTSYIHATRALVPSRVDLLPHCKRFRDSISPEDSVEEDIDTDVLEDIEADATAVEIAVDRDVEAGIDAGICMEVDVGVDVEDEVEDEVESSDRGTLEVGVDVVAGIDIPDALLMPDAVECLEQVEEGLQDIYDHVIEIPLQMIEDIETGQRELESRSLIAGSINMIITRSGMTPKAIKELVNRRVEEALAAYEATCAANALETENQSQNCSDDDNGNGGDGNGREGNGGNGNPNENNRNARPDARECTYQDFMKCQPLNFKETERVVGLIRWFEKMETVFHISNCPEKYQVKYATCTLLNSALTWWNSHKRTIGAEAAFAMSWRELMKLMAEVYCPRNEIQKMESELWNLTVKNNDLAAYT